MLEPDDPLPYAPQRILVNGSAGAGKTTLAKALSAQLGIPHTELDGLHHGPGWVRRPEFLDDVASLASGERWITEWQYGDARPLLLARSDLMIWLDVPRRVVMRRVVRRTLRRRLRREVLWNGNVEGPLHRIFRDPEHIIRWAWTSHPRAAERVAEAREHRPSLPVVRLRDAREVGRWVERLSEAGGTPERPR